MSDLDGIRDLCRSDLKFLSTQILGHRDWDVIHDDVEKVLRRPSLNKMLLLPRGHLKTTFCTIDYSIQSILRDPNIRILIANQVWDKAREMLGEIKDLLETRSDLPRIFGPFKSGAWNQDSMTVRQRTRAVKEGTITTTGVEAESTGGHYDLIILDDLVGLQNYASPDGREKVKRFYRSMRNLLEPMGRLIVLGTRWHLADLYQDILDNETEIYDVMVREAVEDGRVIFPSKFNLAFDRARKCWLPTMEPTLDYIRHLKARLRPSEFASQYLNRPIAEEDVLFKPEYFRYWNERPQGLYVGMTVDLAIGQKRINDYSTVVVGGMDGSRKLYVLDYLRGRWAPAEIISNIMQMHAKWNPIACGMETNGFQILLKEALEKEMFKTDRFFPVQELSHQERTKEFRIQAMEPLYRNGHVLHAAWMKGRDLEDELTTFPKSRNDDLIDAESMLLEILGSGDDLVPEEPALHPQSLTAQLKLMDDAQTADLFFKDLLAPENR